MNEIHQIPPMKNILTLLFLTFTVAVSAQDSEHIFVLHYTVVGAAEDDTLFVDVEATEVEFPLGADAYATWFVGDSGFVVLPMAGPNYPVEPVVTVTIADCNVPDATVTTIAQLDTSINQANSYWYNAYVDMVPCEGNVSLVDVPSPIIEMPRVYPNPSTGGAVQVEWKGPSLGLVELYVYDMIGNEVQRQVINRPSADAAFLIQHHLAPGLYIIQLSQGDVTRSARWVVR